MKLAEFDFRLPQELIAQFPQEARDQSRLMVVNRRRGRWEHGLFSDLPDFLTKDDLLVVNDSRVFPARLFARKEDLGARTEILLLQREQEDIWTGLIKPGRRAEVGTRLVVHPEHLEIEVLDQGSSAERRLRLFCKGDIWAALERFGHTPLPPYIHRPAQPDDRDRYQTVYARKSGSVAAPTAGLHFTAELLEKISYCRARLDVGYGTFKPMVEEEIEGHEMDAEYYCLTPEAVEKIRYHRSAGGRVVAVGTTTTRLLEHIFLKHGEVVADQGLTNLFIRPGFTFGAVEGLITNFHLPRSTLLMLVAAFAGQDLVKRCYQAAIKERYRFYSYGDCMLIL